MLEQLSQASVTQYAIDALVKQEPQGTDRTRGAQVGRTVPAKWWNWLFSAITKRAAQAKNDTQNILTEMQNVVTSAGEALSTADTHQFEHAVSAKAISQIGAYVAKGNALYSYWDTPEAAVLHTTVPRGYQNSSYDYSSIELLQFEIGSFNTFKGVLYAPYIANFRGQYVSTPSTGTSRWPGCIFSIDNGKSFFALAIRDYCFDETYQKGYGVYVDAYNRLPRVQIEVFEGTYYINCQYRVSSGTPAILFELLLSTVDFRSFSTIYSEVNSSGTSQMRPLYIVENNLYWGEYIVSYGNLVPPVYKYGYAADMDCITPTETALLGSLRDTSVIKIPNGFVGPAGILTSTPLSGDTQSGIKVNVRALLRNGSIFMSDTQSYSDSDFYKYCWLLDSSGNIQKFIHPLLSIAGNRTIYCVGAFDGAIFWTIGFDLYRSYDGVNYEYLSTIPATAWALSMYGAHDVLWYSQGYYFLDGYYSSDLLNWQSVLPTWSGAPVVIDKVTQAIVSTYSAGLILSVKPSIAQASISVGNQLRVPFSVVDTKLFASCVSPLSSGASIDFTQKQLTISIRHAYYSSSGKTNRVIGYTLCLG